MKGITFIAVAVVALAVVAGGLVFALEGRGQAEAGGLGDLQKQLLVLRTQVGELQEANEHLEQEVSQQQKIVGTLLKRVAPDAEFALAMHITGFEGTGEAKNPHLEVKQGDLVRINLTNKEAVEHDWVIDGMAHSGHLETMGATTSLVFVADRAGEFAYYCSVPGHREAGMVGKLEVAPLAGMGHMGADKGHMDEASH
ncbi:MAG: cupredoxin domain-containing protein [Chloroflexi bacterium]|nr:cupredoxin domain-containing protein [Chloroflexota bacterium]